MHHSTIVNHTFSPNCIKRTLDLSAVADSRQIFVHRKPAEKIQASRQKCSAKYQPKKFDQLQICFGIMTDVMMTSDILIIRLIKLCSADVLQTDMTWSRAFFIKVNLLRLSCTSRKSAICIISYMYSLCYFSRNCSHSVVNSAAFSIFCVNSASPNISRKCFNPSDFFFKFGWGFNGTCNANIVQSNDLECTVGTWITIQIILKITCLLLSD